MTEDFKNNLPQDDAATWESNDQELHISSEEGLNVHLLCHPRWPPESHRKYFRVVV
jgi:hypothetical protein